MDGAVMDGASKETSEKVPISFLIFSKSPYSASKTLHCASGGRQGQGWGLGDEGEC